MRIEVPPRNPLLDSGELGSRRGRSARQGERMPSRAEPVFQSVNVDREQAWMVFKLWIDLDVNVIIHFSYRVYVPIHPVTVCVSL